MEGGDVPIYSPDIQFEKSSYTRVSFPEQLASPTYQESYNYFYPRMVYIGPLHREDENVQTSKKLKTNYMNHLVSRIHSPKKKVLESCVRKVHTLLEQIKACYISTHLDDIACVEMMVVDACFILEFMLQVLERPKKPYLGNLRLINTILHDLVLLGNQIPFFVLDQIFQCTILTINPKASLVELLLPVLSCNNLFKTDINIMGISTNRIPHILGLLHYCYKPPVDKFIPYSRISTILSTVDLHKPWVLLKPHKDSTSYLSVDYSKLLNRLTLTMPVLCVDDRTESLLWNFIAYEQSCADEPYASHKPITSYVHSIRMLMRTKEDAAKLIDSGVLVNYLGSNEAVVSIFNTILQFENKWKPSNKNCNGSEIWMRSAFVSSLWKRIPWNMIAVLAVIIMFALSVAQTIFTIKHGGSNK